jgi:hypothetical protein
MQKQYVNAAEARRLQQVGEWVPAPDFAETGHEYFDAHYMIVWRPDNVINYNDPDRDPCIAIRLK